MAKNYSSRRSGGSVNFIMAAVIIVVLALAVVAVWGPIQSNYKQNRVSEGPQTVGDYADYMGLEYNEFLDMYGLTDGNGITKKDDISTLMDVMTLGNWSKFYSGTEITDEELAAFKADQGLGDDVTKDTLDPEVNQKYATYAQAKQAAEQASQAPADSSATTDAAASTDASTADTAATAATDTTTDTSADTAAE